MYNSVIVTRAEYIDTVVNTGASNAHNIVTEFVPRGVFSIFSVRPRRIRDQRWRW